MTNGGRRWAFAVLMASLALGGCGSSSSSGPGALSDDSGSGDDATEPGGSVDSGPMMVTGPRDSGSHPADASTCGTRVNSGIMFSAAGVPYCAANMTCDLTQNTCCVNALGAGSCTSGHDGCGVEAELSAAFECIEATDCPSGQVCCGYADSTNSTAGSKCQNVSGNGNKCSPAPTATQGSVQLCQKTCECKDGSECVPQSCNVGASLPANLTMCGLQSAKPYNCTAK